MARCLTEAGAPDTGKHATLCGTQDTLGISASLCDALCDCPTGKSPESCPAPFAKIFRLTCRANHRHNSARLTADEGRWPSSRTCGEMRWTRELRLTCAA